MKIRLTSLDPLLKMAMEAPSLLVELKEICQRLSKVKWQDKDVAQRTKACTIISNFLGPGIERF